MFQFAKSKMTQSLVTFVACRKTLMTVAKLIGGLEPSEASCFLDALHEEIERLRMSDASSKAWIQATSTLSGVESYAIEKCGLWPGSDN